MSAGSTSIDQLVGQNVGKYHIKLHLGHGHVSAVYLAQEQAQDRTVVLTVFEVPDAITGEARTYFLRRFAQEAAQIRRLDHPYILPTCDFGEQFSYPYLVTPFVEEGSLAKLLKQQTHTSPVQTLAILRQIAEGLDYAHANGVVHGILKPANVLLDSKQVVRITGFGLMRMLALRGLTEMSHPQSHLLSVASTFLGNPKYIAPEVVVGSPADARSDVYALGMMLYELLSGTLPFTGSNPFEVAMQHVSQDIPPLQTVYPYVPDEVGVVLQQALDRDPSRRYQSAGQLAVAFERALGQSAAATQTAALPTKAQPQQPVTPVPPATPLPATPPPTNWFEEEIAANGKWHLMSPDATGYVPIPPGLASLPLEMKSPITSVETKSPAMTKEFPSGGWQLRPPIVTSQMAALNPSAPLEVSTLREPTQEPVVEQITTGGTAEASKRKEAADFFEMSLLDAPPSAEWLEVLQAPESSEAEPSPEQKEAPPYLAAPQPLVTPQNEMVNHADVPNEVFLKRRRKIILLATGGVVAAGIVGAGGLSLAHLIQSSRKVPPGGSQTPMPATPTANPNKQSIKGTHTGTVIGDSKQAVNSAKGFSNPPGQQGSLLIHLPNGNFVAYESACTHQGVTVEYQPQTHHLVCPKHGSIFDPANNSAVLKGPDTRSLARVAIHVNADGTVTVG